MDDLIARAQAFATTAHAGQVRKDAARTPYITHPAEVAARVAALGGGPEAIAAAWLHDTVEDCGVTLSALDAAFGPAVAAIVAEVTDTKTLSRLDRKRRQVEGAAIKSPSAALVKLADKTANVDSLRQTPPADWPPARQMAYVDWAEAVVGRLTVAGALRAGFLTAANLARAAIAARDDQPETA